MGRVKQPPCIGCRKFRKCKQFFIKRKTKYDADRDACEDYNCESFIMLGRECKLLNQYLFLDEVAFPSRNYHFFWWPQMKNKISDTAWVKRLNLFTDIWDILLEPNSM